MPNLRSKTWTTTTPANVEDAQYWEDHLISDADALKITTSVQSVNNTTPDAQGNVDIVALPDGGTAGQVLTKQSSLDGDADWEDPASSGHTIIDEHGDDMPYRTNLQFISAEVTDDSVNDTTIVDCKGEKGDPGQAATITIGTTTTLPAGSSATVTNSGTASAAVFNFGIPKGADGTGAGDMLKADYDPNSVVELAGGIPDYVASQAYTLPTAASNVLGGVKVGTNLSIDASGVLSATDTNTDALHDLTDVNISLPSDGQALLYDSASSKWVNGDVAGSASDITYDNTDSGLSATNAQDAIDEIETNVETKANSADVPLKTQITNPNLLDNPWFTINQRGQNSYTADVANMYTFDRWKMEGTASVDYSITQNADKTVTITNNTNDQEWFTQFQESSFGDGNTDFTISVLVTSISGTAFIGTGATTHTVYQELTSGLNILTFKPTDFALIRIITLNDSSVTIKAIKLEKGSISTLALDSAPNYATELLKCQRYFLRIPNTASPWASLGMGISIATNGGTCIITTPSTMRTLPIVTSSGSFMVRGGGGVAVVSSISSSNFTAIGITLNTLYTDNAIPALYSIETYVNNDAAAYIDLSADL